MWSPAVPPAGEPVSGALDGAGGGGHPVSRTEADTDTGTDAGTDSDTATGTDAGTDAGRQPGAGRVPPFYLRVPRDPCEKLSRAGGGRGFAPRTQRSQGKRKRLATVALAGP